MSTIFDSPTLELHDGKAWWRNSADKLSRPQGVGAGRNPPLWLQDGDVVKVSLEGVGSCTNTVEHVKNEGSKPKL